ncbi:MAG: hypothetical protein QNK19_02540 [Xanthomonadales bacterium]|nr:hypothetical protein [Xanthomonadales bacterium]
MTTDEAWELILEDPHLNVLNGRINEAIKHLADNDWVTLKDYLNDPKHANLVNLRTQTALYRMRQLND